MEDVLTRSPPGTVPEVPAGGTSSPDGPGPPGPRRRRSRWPGWAGAGRGLPRRLADQDLSGRLSGWKWFDLVLVSALMALSLALRWRTLWTSYWGDEAIAIGIAVHPVRSLPHYLVNDGSPPLYYVMLHFWMRLFGRSEQATHALSMIAALACVPVAWWSGRRLFGLWAARAAAAMVATCAYLDYYSTETRMYSWLVLAAIAGITCFVLAFSGAGRGYWAAATVLMTAVLYLQYYGLYLLAATVVAGTAVALWGRSRQKLLATLLYGGTCLAAFAPWARQFFYQVDNTGAPWAPHPSWLDFFGDPFNALASAAWAAPLAAIALAVLAPRVRARPAGPAAARGALALTTAIPLLVLALAWLAAQVVNSWNPRYLGIAVVPGLVALAGGLARARWRLPALVAVTVAMALTATPVLVDRGVTVRTSKSDVAYLLAELKPELRPGALVISAEVTNTPVVALDLGPGYRYATPFGLLADPLVVNWSDLPTRLQDINAESDLARLLSKVPVGGQVLLFNPTTWGGEETPQRYAGPVKAEGVAANQVIVTDPQLRAEVTEPVPRYSDPLYPMTATLFVKI